MMLPEYLSIPFIALYAETHFRFFKWFPSLLFKKEPEILFDMPARIAPGKDIPVFLMLNDVDRYPVTIEEVTITLSQNNNTRIIFTQKDLTPYLVAHPFDFQSTVYLFVLPRTLFQEGAFALNGKALIRQKKSALAIVNDNYFGSSKLPLTGTIASTPFPGYDQAYYGDLHTHTQYSRSHVEFGPPLSIIDTNAFATGLTFTGITDHSYDLACTMHNYLTIDPQVESWNSLQQQIKPTGSSHKTIQIPGEEISCINRNNSVVHLGALGISRFIPGNRDGARKQKKCIDLTICDAAKEVHRQGGISFAAHPGSIPGFLQRIFLNRGLWSLHDIDEKINCFQAVNTGFSASWYRARKTWINALLGGRKLPLIAGNDAHGDFNRYRAIKTPFISIYENFERHFGFARTGIYGPVPHNHHDVLDALRTGKTFITTGPFMGIYSSSAITNCLVSHTPLSKTIPEITIEGISSSEFGTICTIRILRGYFSDTSEKILRFFPLSTPDLFHIKESIPIDWQHGNGYIRAELLCVSEEGKETMAVTSPIYLEN